MTKIVIAWELGSGLGHVGPLRAIGGELARRGHRVTIAAANVELCRQAFAGTGVESVRGPELPLSERRLKVPCTYSDVLHDCGYSSAEAVTVAVREWLGLFERLGAEALLADHSPTALLANRVRQAPAVALGPGFVCPPDMSPLPSLHRVVTEPHWAASVEQTVLESMNAALAAHGGASLERVTEIFAAADAQYLLTYPELDHYGPWRGADPRPATYRQPVGNLPGETLAWPEGEGIAESPRVFVYLRRHEALAPILRGLAYKRYPSICYAPHMDADCVHTFAGTSVRLTQAPVHLPTTLRGCAAAVLHGGHGTICEALRAGVPLLLLPQMLEQQVTADRIRTLNVGLAADLHDIESVATALEEVIEDASFAKAALALKSRFAGDVSEEAAIASFVDEISDCIMR